MDPILLGFALAIVLFVVLARVIVQRSGQQDADEIAPSTPAQTLAAGDSAAAEVSTTESGDASKPDGHTLYEGLSKTRSEGFIGRISRLFASEAATDDVLDDLEEALLTADIGVQTAHRLFETLRETLTGDELRDPERVWALLRREVTTILETAARQAPSPPPQEGPRVVMVLGVNGSGKTTSIGKLAARAVHDGQVVNLVAGDTFRAAAAEQLELWGKRVGAEVTRGEEGADPSSVVFDGLRSSLERGADLVFVDTAGRLHTQTNLMDELKKVRKVMGKAIPGSPHEVLLVVDATTGQNAIQQAHTFHETTDVTGIVLTKLDGTAKGGVVIGVCDTLAIPIRYIGVGERVSDLRPFDPEEFVEALFAP